LALNKTMQRHCTQTVVSESATDADPGYRLSNLAAAGPALAQIGEALPFGLDLPLPPTATVSNASSSDLAEGPPLGEYYCNYGGGIGRGQVYGPARGLYLLEGGRYHAEDDEIGTYTYDPATGTIAFSGGFYDRIDATGEFKGGSHNEIDIAPEGGVYTFCSLQ
jgi:hypothetical protein